MDCSVEVIVCTFIGGLYLREQLKSICCQSRPPQWVSIYDDGSSDNTLEVLADCTPRFAALNIGLKVVRNLKNLGYAANFAQGVEQAVGDPLFFCDQDDRWHPDKVRFLAELLETSNADLAFSDGNMIDAAGKLLLATLRLCPCGPEMDGLEHRNASNLPDRQSSGQKAHS